MHLLAVHPGASTAAELWVPNRFPASDGSDRLAKMGPIAEQRRCAQEVTIGDR